ncbi:substrate-binding domain-containing protein [Conexibacter sp. JD483]|uniref:substrate-binding domain-containing protein n=1 Tax=unclassified Conexibacter TaxID=2627773 RepID=UPI00271B7671|nr:MULTISPECIES: substrate-binding domain-containing protein [unclassified Conexibacter]MDO8188360.1 substrate-binding domain-containing protein [Conexibacter sp. CPCC 205706]MDO8201106.1 substrate-binding domain-containing protein [Conexibacter sp. CPCC 205762]MDR9372160.1 substrate-binding domain-containing protein [Conexibacter sp. JD483]
MNSQLSRAAHRVRALLALALACAVTLGVAACGDSSSSSSGSDGGSASTSSSTSGGDSGAAPASASAEELEARAGKVDGTEWCGDRPITLGIHDGFGVNAWSKASYATVRSEAARCPNVRQVVAAGGADLQKSISDVNGMVAQGIDALAIIPDFGAAQVPSLKAATQAGVRVIAWGADPSGQRGTDYDDYVDWDTKANGAAWARWMAETLRGRGNVVFLGGPAGTPVSIDELKGVVETFKQYPDIRLLTGDKDYPATNWDPAQAQRTMAALLAQYPDIDGAIIDYGDATQGALRAFQQANRRIVPIATTESHAVACEWDRLKGSNPDFELATISSRNWLGRIAARKAIAAAEGIPLDEPSIFALGLTEDSTGDNKPRCDPRFPADTYFSNDLSEDDLAKYGKTN